MPQQKYFSIRDDDPRIRRYITEGICPQCRIPMERAGFEAARCSPCGTLWFSPRIPYIFPANPKLEIPRLPDWPGRPKKRF